jgi:hypothetical protein
MGKMKELFTELQNQYGQNLEDAPVDFSMDNYLRQKSQELEMEQSVCCGANLNQMVTPNGPDYKDIGICPECGDNV